MSEVQAARDEVHQWLDMWANELAEEPDDDEKRILLAFRTILKREEELTKQLQESTTDLVITSDNIHSECRRDPKAAERWEGVTDHLRNQITINRTLL